MKKYIFITMLITEISGAVQYLFNKQNFLLKKGYDVHIFSAMPGKIRVLSLKKYSNSIYPALMYNPKCFTNFCMNKTIAKIIKTINPDSNDEILIESNSVNAALWAELLASKIKAKHINFNLQEKHDYSKQEISFLRFKFKRKELCGITPKSVNLMLNDDTIDFEEWMAFSAYCNNVVENVQDDFSSLLNGNANFTIGCIGRTNKQYIPLLLKELSSYFEQHLNETFNLVFIGGSDNKAAERLIYKKMHMFKNVKTVITGYVYPIPRSFIEKIDLFISTAGSAYATFLEARPTIKINAFNALPLGIMGYNFDAEKSTIYDDSTGLILIDCINLVRNGIDIKYENDLNKRYYNKMFESFSKQLNMFNLNTVEEYYNIDTVSVKKDMKQLIYCFFGHILGPNIMQYLLHYLRKIC